MDAKSLGKIIKDARLSKKLTQNEVVGSFITRNMLSQIESGTAMPSVKTLEYLCRTLDISLDVSDALKSSDTMGYLSMRQLFRDGRFSEVIECDEDEGYLDECRALRARAYLELAVKLGESIEVADNAKAVEYAKQAKALSAEGIFASAEIGERADEAIKTAAGKLSSYYGSLT